MANEPRRDGTVRAERLGLSGVILGVQRPKVKRKHPWGTES